MKKILFASLILNLLLILTLLFLSTIAVIPETRETVVSNSYKSVNRIYKDKVTGCKIGIAKTTSYYPNGNICYLGIEVNGTWEYFISYAPDGKALGEIMLGKGRLIIPDDNGHVSPEGTTAPFNKANCYYRYGEQITKKEYDRREEMQRARIERALKGE